MGRVGTPDWVDMHYRTSWHTLSYIRKSLKKLCIYDFFLYPARHKWIFLYSLCYFYLPSWRKTRFLPRLHRPSLFPSPRAAAASKPIPTQLSNSNIKTRHHLTYGRLKISIKKHYLKNISTAWGEATLRHTARKKNVKNEGGVVSCAIKSPVKKGRGAFWNIGRICLMFMLRGQLLLCIAICNKKSEKP